MEHFYSYTFYVFTMFILSTKVNESVLKSGRNRRHSQITWSADSDQTVDMLDWFHHLCFIIF